VSYDRDASPYLNGLEQRLLGWLVRRLLSTANPRLQQAIDEKGLAPSARMGCVNATRVYAALLFVLGLGVRVAGLAPGADVLFALAAACMVWSFWALYTVHLAERDATPSSTHRLSPSQHDDGQGRSWAARLSAAQRRLSSVLRLNRARKAPTSPPAGW